ncbi:MAG: hypothetical protein EPN86_03910 [Nanoarchaeota archaeon]|nr:MAG: hypothetical protein EPN86_03910 [Nanoarchaeota archaeon]
MAETSLEHIVGAGIVIGYFLKSPNVVLGSSISGLYHGTTAVLSAPAKTPGMISHYFENRRRFRAAKELFDCDESNTFIDVTPQIYDDQTIYSNALPPILVLAGEN